jgi:hypothetical protein
VILLDNLSNEVKTIGIIEAELKQMTEINKKCDFLLINKVVSLNFVVLDWRPVRLYVLLCSINVSLVVDIILTQLETIAIVRVYSEIRAVKYITILPYC